MTEAAGEVIRQLTVTVIIPGGIDVSDFLGGVSHWMPLRRSF